MLLPTTESQLGSISRTMDLILPDWSALDTVRRSPLPFALWTIGDQCLLHHWLDYAVNQSVSLVRIYTADRVDEVARLLAESLLWPIETETIALRDGLEPPPGAIMADHFPEHPSPPPPRDGWDLLQRAAQLEAIWLDQLHADPIGELLRTGSNCRLHPEAVLIPPYYIGDDVMIGPGCQIGPYAVIGTGSLISGANLIARSHLSPHSYLGPVTALEDCILENSVLINLRNKARLTGIEAHLAASLNASPSPIPMRHRLRALWLYLSSFSVATGKEESFTTFDGRRLPGNSSSGLGGRRALLPLVWQGKLPLYGILPRTLEQFSRLSQNWQNLIGNAPIGVFSYADCQGCHSPDDPEEAAHAVYQATLPSGSLRSGLRKFASNLKPSDFIPRTHAQ